MFEFISLYEKGATTLFPVVVFVAGYSLKSVDESGIVKLWEVKRDKFNQKGATNAAAFCDRVIQILPLALTWLLGWYDQQLDGQDTLFHLFDEQGLDCSDIFRALADPVQIRYPFYSQVAKQEKIQENIDKALDTCGRRLQPHGLSSSFERFSSRFKGYSDRLATNPDLRATEILFLLGEIATWLQDLQDEEIPQKACRVIAQKMKQITGLLLIDVFAEKKILRLLHELNRQKSFAHVELKHENDCMFQILVSAVSLLPAGFRWHGSDRPSLKGKKELVMLETGINECNLYESLDREQQYKDVYKNLLHQMGEILRGSDISSGTHDDIVEVIDLMRTDAEAEGFYLLLNEQKLRKEKGQGDFCKDFANKLPNITQVITGSNTENRVQSYLIDGLSSGALFSKIITIYVQTKKLNESANADN
jgi:hypothetical protein